MQRRRKSARHQRAADQRWRLRRAQQEREAGIPDREPWHDGRAVLTLDLRTHGGRLLRIEPRVGYIACRVYDDETGELLECAALKTALHHIADSLPRTLAQRHCQ